MSEDSTVLVLLTLVCFYFFVNVIVLGKLHILLLQMQFRREEDGELSAEEVHKPKPDKRVSILRNNKLFHIIGNEIGG